MWAEDMRLLDLRKGCFALIVVAVATVPGNTCISVGCIIGEEPKAEGTRSFTMNSKSADLCLRERLSLLEGQ